QKSISYVSPVDLLQIIRSIYPTFRNFQQQDAQEFLRCFLDALHDDLKQPVYEWESNKIADRWSMKRGRISSEEKRDGGKNFAKRDKMEDDSSNDRKSVNCNSRSNVASCSSSSSVDDDNFRTCDSGWSSDTVSVKLPY
uniref:ubiquitinyl hydrolase 1 n=1 Tax=Romanomermis culicivorax TaxID=13658 RepID=A0A915IYA2_ROMCU